MNRSTSIFAILALVLLCATQAQADGHPPRPGVPAPTASGRGWTWAAYPQSIFRSRPFAPGPYVGRGYIWNP